MVSLPCRLFVLALAASPLAFAQAPPPEPPVRAVPGDAALGEQMSHCAAVLHEVQRQSLRRRLAMSERDATALMRYTMLASAALLGEEKGFAEMKARQSQLKSKLNLTREENVNRVLNAEAASCIEAVESNKESLNAKVVRLPEKN